MKRSKNSKIRLLSVVMTVALLLSLGTVFAQGPVEPSDVVVAWAGEPVEVEKKVTTPEIPPVVDICLLEDETGSFGDDIDNLQGGTTASDIYDTSVATSPDADFAVAGFRDYPEEPYGWLGDHVYRLLSGMSGSKSAWLDGIAALTASGGNDIPEAQYDAIVAAAGPGTFQDPTEGEQGNCGWRDPATTPGVQRVLVVAVDSPFHLPGTGKPHVNDQASTIAALNDQNIIVVGLTAPGAAGELAALAAATGGSTQPLSSDGANIAEAILAGLEELTTDVWWEVDADLGLKVTLSPAVHYGVSGNTTVTFIETIEVTAKPDKSVTLCATVTFIANEYENEGAPIGTQKVCVKVVVIDIKPWSYPNSINTKSMGVVPVAILGSDSFDVKDVDVTTLAFGPDGAAPAHDLTDPAVYMDHLQDANGDGYTDLVSHYRQKETGIELGDYEACLTGEIFGVDGFVACDSVRVVK